MQGLYWLRSDLRLRQNKTLEQFKTECKSGLIIWCPTKSYNRASQFRKSFIDDCVLQFSKSLEPYQQLVVVETQSITHVLNDYIQKYKIEKVFCTAEYAIDEVNEEKTVYKICQENKIQFENFDQNTLITESNLPFLLADMPFVFTNFRKKIEVNLKVNSLVQTSDIYPEALIKKATNSLNDKKLVLFKGGEQAALSRLQHYLWGSDAIQTYKETRNGMIDLDDSSKFSPWLSTGCLSAVQIYHEIKKYEFEICANDSTYWLIFELLWRDYFKFFSKKYGYQLFSESGVTTGDKTFRKMSAVQLKFFNQWCEGVTPDDFVNANMLELKNTGWMSNRGRQNVASYLIHDLNVKWTLGASYFEKMLIDYDPDSNWGNWLYLSGQGSDPRSRKFNTQKQADDYDSSGNYRRKWLG